MFVNRPVFRLTVILLFAVAYSKRRCNYSVILSTYQTLILAELQNLNLTGPSDISATRDRCPSNKVYYILRSIYGMTQLFACQGKGQGRDNMGKVVERMGLLIRQNCRSGDLEKRQKMANCKAGRRSGGRRKKRMKIIGMLRNCWQKLQSVYR